MAGTDARQMKYGLRAKLPRYTFSMNDHEKRFLEQIQKENEAAHAQTRQQFAEFAQAIQQRFDASTQAIQERFDAKTDEIEAQFQETAQDMRRHFDTVYEATRGEIQLIAESLAHVDQKVDAANAKVDRRAADTEAMIKLAFGNLDRRLRIVEDIVLPQKPS
jgi:TolA-binding protein